MPPKDYELFIILFAVPQVLTGRHLEKLDPNKVLFLIWVIKTTYSRGNEPKTPHIAPARGNK